MTEIEELSETSDITTHTDPPESFDEQGRCHHQHVFEDPVHPYLRRCACSNVRYYICQFCSVVINLARSAIVWPHTCNDCSRPACVPCANDMRRVDHSVTDVVCPKCDTSPDVRQTWVVIYRTTLIDREKRHHVMIRPHPRQFRDRDEAARGALGYFQTVVPSNLSSEALDAFAKSMQKTYKGWMNSPELRSGYEILKAEVGLFPLHSPDTPLLELPRGQRID